MEKQDQTTDALKILNRRYISGDPKRETSLQEERANAEISRTIYELRKEAGLNQKELADLIGTTQSVISRLEDADYEGHSLSMLNRIAKALNQRLTVLMTADDPEVDTVRYVFREFVRGLRRRQGLTLDEFANKVEIDRNEVIAMERNIGYRPTPLTIYKLSQFYKIPQQKLAELAGHLTDVPEYIKEETARYAAQSESFSKLTREERQLLDKFVKYLRTGT